MHENNKISLKVSSLKLELENEKIIGIYFQLSSSKVFDEEVLVLSIKVGLTNSKGYEL